MVTEGIDWAVENAEDFMEKLMNELSGLTKANIHSIMAVETDVIRLFNIMDHALHELCRSVINFLFYSKLDRGVVQ